MISVTTVMVLPESDISARQKSNFESWCRMLILVGCVIYQQICLFKGDTQRRHQTVTDP
jgi:hypothetical protein